MRYLVRLALVAGMTAGLVLGLGVLVGSLLMAAGLIEEVAR